MFTKYYTIKVDGRTYRLPKTLPSMMENEPRNNKISALQYWMEILEPYRKSSGFVDLLWCRHLELTATWHIETFVDLDNIIKNVFKEWYSLTVKDLE